MYAFVCICIFFAIRGHFRVCGGTLSMGDLNYFERTRIPNFERRYVQIYAELLITSTFMVQSRCYRLQFIADFLRKTRARMEIICAGYPKTGSKSCTAALEELGIKVCDSMGPGRYEQLFVYNILQIIIIYTILINFVRQYLSKLVFYLKKTRLNTLLSLGLNTWMAKFRLKAFQQNITRTDLQICK